MNSFKKFSLVILIVLLCVPAAGIQAQDDDTVRVVWMHSPSERQELFDLVESFATDFESAHPGTDVEIIFVEWSEGREKLLEMVDAGDPPDITMLGSRWVPEFVSLGLIEPLDNYMSRDFRRKFVPSIINEGAVYQGRTFGLPIAASTRALYYNQDMFEAAGIENPPETWDELLAAGKAINALDAGYYGFGLQGGGGVETNTYFYYFVWGNGGNLYNSSRTASAINEEAAVEALEFIKSMIDENATQPDPAAETYERRRALEDMFIAEELAMVISGTWFIGRLRSDAPDLNFGEALPYNTTPSTYGVIDTLVMLKTSENKDLAWQFLESLYTEESRLAYALTAGVLPEMTAVANSDEMAGDEAFSVFLSLLPDARFEPLHIQSEQIAQTVIDAIRAVYQDESEPQAALDDAANEIDRMLESSTVGW